MKRIILASTSPRRRELLEKLGVKFEIVSSDFEEDMSLNLRPLELAKFLSAGKAEAVTEKYTDSIIIGADTFVVLGEEVLGKPHTEETATKMLGKISGQIVSVITGITVIDTTLNKKISRAVETKIYIKDLSDEEIAGYVKTGEPLDKAGAFAIQGTGAFMIKKIEGDFLGTVGLPLFELNQIFKELGVDIFSSKK